MNDYQINKLMSYIWKINKNKANDIGIIKSSVDNLKLDVYVKDILSKRIIWEKNNFLYEPKRTMVFAGIYNCKLYMICKKCKTIMAHKNEKFDYIESPICPICNNIHLNTFDFLTKDDKKYGIMYRRLDIKNAIHKLCESIYYNILHFVFYAKESIKNNFRKE